MIGRIKKQPLVMLINSGSTYNFIDQTMVKRFKCATKVIVGINVTVADGNTLRSHELCEMIR